MRRTPASPAIRFSGQRLSRTIAVVATATRSMPGRGCGADRSHDPERRGRREASNVDAVLDDRAGAEEPDAGHDVRGHPRRIEHDTDLVAEVQRGPAVRAAEDEEAGAHANEDVRAQARLLLAQLALEPDQAREPEATSSRTTPSQTGSSGPTGDLRGLALRHGQLGDPAGGEVEQRVEAARARTGRAPPSPAPRRAARRPSSRRSCRSPPERPRSSRGRAAARRRRHPTETAAIEPGSAFERPKRSSARNAATYAPVIAAQRVPPSAWSTSQSSQSVRSPSAWKSQIDRSARPIKRWISTVRPSGRPRETARCVRSPVDAGSSEYSAVSQPRPLPRSQRGIVLLQRRGAENDGVPLRVEDAAVRLLEEVGLEVERPQLVRGASRPDGCVTPPPSRAPASSTCSTSRDRQLQEAAAHRAKRLRLARREEP